MLSISPACGKTLEAIGQSVGSCYETASFYASYGDHRRGLELPCATASKKCLKGSVGILLAGQTMFWVTLLARGCTL